MVWLVIVATAAATFLLRLSFIAAVKPHGLPTWAQELLRYVPPAVLAAIVVPDIVFAQGSLALDPANPRIGAAAAALVIAFTTRSVVWSIAGGMAALWALQWVLV